MAKRKTVDVVCYGDEVYLDSLGFSSSRSGTGGPDYLHDITYEGIDYILRICHTEPYSFSSTSVVFFDSIETLLTHLRHLYFDFYTKLVLVLVTTGDSGSNPILQESIRILERTDSFHRLTWLEWKFDETRRSTDLTFQKTLLQLILSLKLIKNSFFRWYDYVLWEHTKNNLKSLLSSHKFNLENVAINEMLFGFSLRLDLRYRCVWWSIPSSYNSSSTKPPIKINAVDTAKELHAGIEHDDGDVHSMFFHEQNCNDIEHIITLLSSKNACIKHLVISNCKGTLSHGFLSSIPEGLEKLILTKTNVNQNDLIIPSKNLSSLRVLCLRYTAVTDEIFTVFHHCKNLEYLVITGSTFTKLPKSFSDLDRLQYLLLDEDAMIFPPRGILQLPAQEIIQYLKELQHKPTTKNREAKIMVVGQEGVGKSTLVKCSKRKLPIVNTAPPEKTDGVEISPLKVNSTEFQVYDLAGDVDYHNTHALFFSRNCLHLAVFDLSNIVISKESRSTDQFCRLELWLQTIASQDPNSYVIIVGTHLDHSMLTPEVLTRIRTTLFDILKKYCFEHVTYESLTKYDECIVCHPEKAPMQQSSTLDSTTVDVADAQSESSCGSIPHILGYHEVSGITNKNIKGLKQSIKVAAKGIKKYKETDIIPKRWLHFRQKILAQLSDEGDLKNQPIAPLAYIQERAADEVGIHADQSFRSMIRFYHSQGNFLWYEDIPEMKDVVILDPQWLSNQLRTLISHLPNIDAICEGFLHHSHLPKIWSDMSEENRSRLMTVFRSVGICISVTDKEDLFPCKLPIGWPDHVMWPPIPESGENQTSLLFEFSFVPASFFPDLIVAINKRKDSFPSNVSPLYYRFNAVFIIKPQNQCLRKRETDLDNRKLHNIKRQLVCRLHAESQSFAVCSETDESLYHRIHMEMTPHSNSLKVTIRGLQPCCHVSDITSMIETVRSQRYPGITYKESLICPKCEIERLHKPSTFDFREANEGFCSKGHKVGSIDEIFGGKVDTSDVVTSTVVHTGRVMGETLDDHFCPKLFVVLPINLDSLSFRDRLVYSLIRDGYAVHLLCECPDQWHFLSSPGFRVGKPKEFFKKYGGRVCKLLRVISALGTPFKIAAAVEPHCKAGAAAASAAHNINKEMKSLLDDYLEKYPHLKPSLGSPDDDRKELKSSRGLQRSELSRFLEVAASGRDFGPLICMYVDKYNEWLWLCEEHYQKYEIVQRQ